MIGTLVLCMMCFCICIIVLNHKLNNLRRDFEEESSRERTVRNIAVNEERCTRRKQLKELRKRVYLTEGKVKTQIRLMSIVEPSNNQPPPKPAPMRH